MGKNKAVKATGLTISVKKTENFGQWYAEAITKSELISYYEDVSGCYILRPWCYRIWETIQNFFDGKIKEMGVEPCYFPMFVSKSALEMEANHLEGFSPEVAWVTKSGQSELQNPIAIRPTSETIMYPAFSKWIRSHRDLPLRLNQWTNVVRWEFKNPTPFIRNREFLWQEGHTCFSTKEEADAEVLEILDLYARVYEEILAVPIIKGMKSDKEKFAGGDYTTTVEAFIPEVGRACQAGTSHSLGQNFSKMFNITFTKDSTASSGNFEERENDAHSETDASSKEYAWQNSWGLSTRTIGIMVMVHGDDKGLVLPPRASPIQVVVIPIIASKTELSVVDKILKVVTEIADLLSRNSIRVKSDLRRDKNPGWKYNYWEQKGVPLRIEIGQNEVENNTVAMVRRDNFIRANNWQHFSSSSTTDISMSKNQNFVSSVKSELDEIQKSMLEKARKLRDERISIAWNFDEFVAEIGKGNLVLAPWCLTTESENWVKEETQRIFQEKSEIGEENEKRGLSGAAKSLCLPFNQPEMPPNTKCFTGNGRDAVEWCLWGRSY